MNALSFNNFPLCNESTLRRVAWQEGKDTITCRDYLRNMSTAEIVGALRMMTEEQRSTVFEELKDEEQEQIVNYIKEDKYKRDRIVGILNAELTNAVIASTVDSIAIMSFIEPIWNKVMFEIKNRDLNNKDNYKGKWKQRFCKAQPFNMFFARYKEVCDYLLDITKGTIMPSFTIELESRCDDYEYADTFIQYSQNIFFKKYESTYNKLYLMALGVAEKFNKKQSKVLSYMYMIYMLADAIDHLTVSTNDCINDVINETNKALCQLDKKEGIHSDPSLSQAKINRKPITDLKQTTVLLIELLKEDDFNETELLPCEKFIDDFVACLIKEEDRLELLDDAINESVLFYNKWYFIQLTKEVRIRAPHSTKCKEEIENVFGSPTGWMRIIKDCKSFNKYIEDKEADDDMDLIDLLDEATESINLPAYKTFLQNISEMRKGLRPSKYRKHYD